MSACDCPGCGGRLAWLAEQEKLRQERYARFEDWLREQNGPCHRSQSDASWCAGHLANFAAEAERCEKQMAVRA